MSFPVPSADMSIPSFSGPFVVCPAPRALEVVRGVGFGPGASENPGRDGTTQMRLPLGEWIVGLRSAEDHGRRPEAQRATDPNRSGHRESLRPSP
jgi:hypothetical protein